MNERTYGAVAPRIGNDVVDLSDPRCTGKSADTRFLARVFSQDEQLRIREADDRDRCLWVAWAAKEAAYKVVSKVEGTPPVFEHSRFQTKGPAGGEGEVIFGSHRVSYRERGDPSVELIHVVAWLHGAEPNIQADLASLPSQAVPLERLSERERQAVHSPSSGWVRILAREQLAHAMNVHEDELEIVCLEGPSGRVPPEVLRGGLASSWDLSLSHHGRYVAWAFTGG